MYQRINIRSPSCTQHGSRTWSSCYRNLELKYPKFPAASHSICFSTVKKKELKSNIRVITSAPKRTKRPFIGSLYSGDHVGKFKYDRSIVFSKFLLESFRLSWDLLASLKKDMSSGIAEEAQMPTLHSSSKERAQKDLVNLQIVQATCLTSSLDAVAQPEIHHPVWSYPPHSRSPSCSQLILLNPLHVTDEKLQHSQ